jgi:manganese/zinc/iron transport system permease protein
MSCALPGNYLLLRRQSMMGDAISHSVLLGIVLAFLFTHALRSSGWISPESYSAFRHITLFAGAVLVGILSALLSEWIQQFGRVESSAALGVVFTTLFAAGLLLIRIAADAVDIDPDCVLYGTIETVVLDTYGSTGIPRAAIANGAVFLVNATLVIVFFKELRIAAFDPSLATVLGINARFVHYALMAVTAVSLVAAFESVGSILVIAMLIVPAATANLLTERLSRMLALSLVVAALSALLGHVFAITLPPLVFGPLGFTSVVDASTAGMMAAASGLLFVLAMLFSPRQGLLSRVLHRLSLAVKIASEDVLGYVYRIEESRRAPAGESTFSQMRRVLHVSPAVLRLALWRLIRGRRLAWTDGGYHLTELGRRHALRLVRAHRLFESYMSRHFEIPADHLHETASRVEHYLDQDLRAQLETELESPARDPHGRKIPDDPEAAPR